MIRRVQHGRRVQHRKGGGTPFYCYCDCYWHGRRSCSDGWSCSRRWPPRSLCPRSATAGWRSAARCAAANPNPSPNPNSNLNPNPNLNCINPNPNQVGGGWKLRFFVLLSTHELLYFESDRSPRRKAAALCV